MKFAPSLSAPKRPTVLVGCLATTVALLCGAPAHAQPPVVPVAAADPYLANPLPSAAPGDIIASRPVTAPAVPARATLISYQSVDALGAPMAVSATVLDPFMPWTGPGERPLVTFAVGTHGQGDQCAPSKLLTELVHYSPLLDVMLEFETAFIDLLLARGIAVVVTDYQGLGTPGTHTYFNRAAEAHAVLDAARAAQRLPGTSIPANGPVGIWGYSQGGGAAAAAAESAGTYAPELDLRGTFAGAPVSHIEDVLSYFDGTSIAGAVGYYLNSVMAVYPEAVPEIEAILNPAGMAILNTVRNQCLFETTFTYGLQQSRQWTTSGRPIAELLIENPVLSAILDEHRVGNGMPSAPVLIIAGDNDDIVPAGQARKVAQSWCSRGATVDLFDAPIPTFLPGLGPGHNINEYAANFLWTQPLLDQMFYGAPARNTCEA
ncbi:lipase family protein [Nocardia sp. NPDC058497]|uniref:lipase family protein n=1 Tax=Nocardia sp. NPDC058497 TaxID=3346529 RepID=UPI003653CFA1